MILNYQKTVIRPEFKTIVLIHGLFGSLSNLAMIARHFENSYNIIQIDVRNHGQSEHHDDINYQLMAQDVLETLDAIGIEQCSLIGHSMGGKIAMAVAAQATARIEKLVVLDMSPTVYQQREHDPFFKALLAVQDAQLQTRPAASEKMREFIDEEMVIQFLLKSFTPQGWRFNVKALYQHYPEILAWQNLAPNPIPSLFLRGVNSPYISTEQQIQAIDLQFPNAHIESIPNAGHWLHAEQPKLVLAAIEHFLNQ